MDRSLSLQAGSIINVKTAGVVEEKKPKYISAQLG